MPSQVARQSQLPPSPSRSDSTVPLSDLLPRQCIQRYVALKLLDLLFNHERSQHCFEGVFSYPGALALHPCPSSSTFQGFLDALRDYRISSRWALPAAGFLQRWELEAIVQTANRRPRDLSYRYCSPRSLPLALPLICISVFFSPLWSPFESRRFGTAAFVRPHEQPRGRRLKSCFAAIFRRPGWLLADPHSRPCASVRGRRLTIFIRLKPFAPHGVLVSISGPHVSHSKMFRYVSVSQRPSSP